MKKKKNLFNITMMMNIIIVEVLAFVNLIVVELTTEVKILGLFLGILGAVQLGVWFWQKFVARI